MNKRGYHSWFESWVYSSYILRRPQNFVKSPTYFWLALHRTKVRWKFCKILWPSQNIWTLPCLICRVQETLNLTGVYFKKRISIFLAYRWWPMPILHPALEMLLILSGTTNGCDLNSTSVSAQSNLIVHICSADRYK